MIADCARNEFDGAIANGHGIGRLLENLRDTLARKRERMEQATGKSDDIGKTGRNISLANAIVAPGNDGAISLDAENVFVSGGDRGERRQRRRKIRGPVIIE